MSLITYPEVLMLDMSKCIAGTSKDCGESLKKQSANVQEFVRIVKRMLKL